jgi:SAM-dependent methyltransferase
MTQARQIEIKNWFDKTYEQRGEWYLRPVDAYKIFLKILKVEKGKKILDVACGLGRIIDVALQNKLETYGIDISEVAIQKTQTKYPNSYVQTANAENLPFKEKQFDYITCLGSLERMLDRPRVLYEMKRVLADNGQLCLLVRNSESWFWKFIQKPLGFINKQGHQDAMNIKDWTVLFENCGYVVSEVYKDQWPMMKWKRYISFGLWNGYERIHYGIIPLKYAYEFIFILRKGTK